MARIAVVGAGIFGVTAALHLDRVGHKVDLYEKNFALLFSASACNQLRLHEGYHYPRSPETVEACRAGNKSFREEYGPAIIDGGRHLYAIASDGSKTSAEGYLTFLESVKLPYRVASCGDILNPETVDLVVEAEESRIDSARLRRLIDRRLKKESGVELHLSTTFRAEDAYDYDFVVVAAYGLTNNVLAGLPAYSQCRLDRFQFEVCEKPIVEMPEDFDVGVVVMDGPFGCVDPYNHTPGSFVLGHVRHAIWDASVGLQAAVPYALAHYLDRGVIQRPIGTRFHMMVEDLQRFVPALADAKYLGSMFTVRTVLPNRDHDDARPTLVEWVEKDHKYLRIFSGKVGTAVDAARRVVEMVGC